MILITICEISFFLILICFIIRLVLRNVPETKNWLDKLTTKSRIKTVKTKLSLKEEYLNEIETLYNRASKEKRSLTKKEIMLIRERNEAINHLLKEDL